MLLKNKIMEKYLSTDLHGLEELQEPEEGMEGAVEPGMPVAEETPEPQEGPVLRIAGLDDISTTALPQDVEPSYKNANDFDANGEYTGLGFANTYGDANKNVEILKATGPRDRILDDSKSKLLIVLNLIIDSMPSEDVNRFGRFLYRVFIGKEPAYEVFAAFEVKNLIYEINAAYRVAVLAMLQKLGYDSITKDIISPETKTYSIKDVLPEEILAKIPVALGEFPSEQQEVIKNCL